MPRDSLDRRNKKKDKKRERKRHPYKKGGGHRSANISLKKSEKK